VFEQLSTTFGARVMLVQSHTRFSCFGTKKLKQPGPESVNKVSLSNTNVFIFSLPIIDVECITQAVSILPHEAKETLQTVFPSTKHDWLNWSHDKFGTHDLLS